MVASHSDAEDPYAPLAPFYDLEYGERTEDLELYLNLAQRTGGPVLEAGAGTGRVALPLAKAGYSVVALDRSSTMLSYARSKLRGAVARRLRLVEGDVRSFHVEERFSLAVLADNTFAELVTQQEQEQALRCISEHLAPGGVLVLVLQNPYTLVLNPPQSEVVLVWESIGSRAGEQTAKFSANEADLANQLLHVHLWYDVTAADGTVRRFSSRFTQRWSYRPELELLLERTGFRVENWYGDYNLEPYEAHSPLLIVVGEKSG